ncbi:uncharacterized protein LOC113344572 [Papaver somniferum]|uniref:uncharacterized protein LOC113344572 n=1 Tax=Papaver somniferum TaxID=3469 RepID=UPI000E6F7798|nr:uncharacterized protein LOC113344572 [Papaver somniferum]
MASPPLTAQLDEIVIDNGLLTLSNFDTWKVNMKNNVFGEDLWGIIDGSDFKPYEYSAKYRLSLWEDKNKKAMNAIKASCGPEMLPAILYIKDAKEAWDSLALITSSTEHKHRYTMVLAAAQEAKEKLNEFEEADRILTLSNYQTWRAYMELLLESEYLWDIVDGNECGEMGSMTWSDKNKRALEIINMSCGPIGVI